MRVVLLLLAVVEVIMVVMVGDGRGGSSHNRDGSCGRDKSDLW